MARQIDAAAERQLIVDHDNLLMMGGADGMVIVKSESNAARHPPSEPPSRQRIALERVECAVVPRQDVAPKLWASSCDKRQQLVEPRRRVRRRDAGVQIDVGRDVPAQTEHGLAGAEQGLPDQAEVVGSILNAVKAGRALDAPAVLSRLDDSVWRVCDVAFNTRGGADHSAGLNRRNARLISNASVSGTTTNSAAPINVPGDGSRNAFVT